MPRSYFHRSDVNQKSIVGCLRKLGMRVHVWGEEADLIIQFLGLTVLGEVRQQGKPRKPRKGRQEEFHNKGFMVYWLQTEADCIALHKTFQEWGKKIWGIA